MMTSDPHHHLFFATAALFHHLHCFSATTKLPPLPTLLTETRMNGGLRRDASGVSIFFLSFIYFTNYYRLQTLPFFFKNKCHPQPSKPNVPLRFTTMMELSVIQGLEMQTRLKPQGMFFLFLFFLAPLNDYLPLDYVYGTMMTMMTNSYHQHHTPSLYYNIDCFISILYRFIFISVLNM